MKVVTTAKILEILILKMTVWTAKIRKMKTIMVQIMTLTLQMLKVWLFIIFITEVRAGVTLKDKEHT